MTGLKKTLAATLLLFAGMVTNETASAAEVSYYADFFHGRRTASGLIFNQGDARMAAHKTLPFGTVLKVTTNGRSLPVIVVDRGPYVPGRVVDMTRTAANILGFRHAGHTRASITRVGFIPNYKDLFRQ